MVISFLRIRCVGNYVSLDKVLIFFLCLGFLSGFFEIINVVMWLNSIRFIFKWICFFSDGGDLNL